MWNSHHLNTGKKPTKSNYKKEKLNRKLEKRLRQRKSISRLSRKTKKVFKLKIKSQRDDIFLYKTNPEKFYFHNTLVLCKLENLNREQRQEIKFYNNNI